MIAAPPTFLPPTPAVRGGIVGKPFPTSLHGRKLTCTTHLYSDGMVVRCTLTRKDKP